MENHQKLIKQQPESQSSEWFQIWSKYLCQTPYTSQKMNETSANIIQNLMTATLQGDSCIKITQEEILLLKNLALDEKQVSSHAIAPFIYDQQSLYLYRYWALENSLARHIIRLVKQPVHAISVDGSPSLFTDEYQQQALNTVVKNSLSIITGGPGTGKTYTLARIIAVLNRNQSNLRIALAAPTGKAAQRMKEALQNSFNDPKLSDFITPELKDIIPITIHRLLGLGHSVIPKFNEKRPLPYDLVVIDEASMLDLNLANMLLSAISDQTRLILLGDAQQLSSVDVGNVLADLQKAEALVPNRMNLVKSRRFKEGAKIGKMAKFIQEEHDKHDVLTQFTKQITSVGTLHEIGLQADMKDVVQLELLPEDLSSQLDLSTYYDQLFLGFNNYAQSIHLFLNSTYSEVSINELILAFDQYRILTAIRHSSFGLATLNRQMEQRFLQVSQQIKQGDWYIGRPVMMTYNDYQLGLSNGDIGICLKRHLTQDAPFEVYFPSLEKWVLANRLPKNIETAYVLTIHKSQGSEFKHTAVVLDQMAIKLLSKELIYTAITRAKSVVSLLVDPNAFTQAITVATVRKSGLSRKIDDLF